MVLSYNFIKKYFNTTKTPQEIYDTFTAHSIEIDRMFNISDVKGIVTGKVISKVKHPNSNKLSICNVDYGQGIKQILCGASNVYENMITAVAPVGTKLAPDFTIAEKEIAGELSQGMLCAFSEIVTIDVNSEKYNDGIIDFGTELEVGLDVNTLLGLDDVIYELGITPNRVDLLNFIGQILETKAVLKQGPVLFDFDFDYDKTTELQQTNVDIKITDKNASLCEYFNITQIGLKDFSLSYSEEYFLMINNISLVNPVVDLGNYAMLVTGQPVNFYDADKVKTSEVTIRPAFKNEEFIGLNKKLINLTENDIVVAAGNKILSIAGVMCSNEFCVDDTTQNVLLEIGRFNPTMIRKTAAKHNLRSDSSFRFERGISREATFDVNNFIKRYLLKHGCDISSEKFVSNISLDETQIEFSLEDLSATTGYDFSIEEVSTVLDLLTFEFSVNENIFVVNISLRHNPFTIKEDLYEEIIRIFGYDKITPILPPVNEVVVLNKFEQTSKLVKNYLSNKEINQVLTYSLVSEKQNSLYNHGTFKGENIKLALPLSKDREFLRNNLTSSLFEVLALNVKNQIKNVSIFEIGEIFTQDFENKEKQMLNVMVSGTLFESFNKTSTQMDFFYLKSILSGLLTKLNIDLSKVEYKTDSLCKDLHPYQSANIYVDGKYLGFIGKLMDKKIKDVFTFEIDFDLLVQMYNENIEIKEFSTQPSTQKDFSVVCNTTTTYNEIKNEILSLNLAEIVQINIKNEFIDEKLGRDMKSVLIRITFNDDKKTLNEEQISNLYKTVVNKLNENYIVQ